VSGMRVLVLTNMYPSSRTPRAGTFVEQQVQGLRTLGLDIEVLLVDRAGGGPLRYAATGRILDAAIRHNQWDVLHVMYGGVMADLATRRVAGLATVVSFCGVDLLGADYGSWWYRSRTGLGVRASRRAARRADAIIVKSRNLRDGLPIEVDSSRVFIIPNGISLDRFRPMDRQQCRARLGWERDGFHVLFSTADRRSAKKRYRLAEEALRELGRRGVRAELHGLSNVPHDQVPMWINAADVLLFTSRSDEGSPNLVKECLACNLPVVSVDAGDVAERIDGIAGCYLVGAEPAALAAALEQVHAGPRAVESRDRMRDLSLEAVAERVKAVYARALEIRRRREEETSAVGTP